MQGPSQKMIKSTHSLPTGRAHEKGWLSAIQSSSSEISG
jgi:hypothetical protein